jgi:hypothetical protein
MFDSLSDRPSRRTTKYLLVISFILLIVMVPVVIGLLQLSNYGGELSETQLGFNGEYIKSNFSRMTAEEIAEMRKIITNFARPDTSCGKW